MQRLEDSNDEFDFDQIAVALDKYEQRADEIRRMLSQLYKIHENYTGLYKRLLTFDKKIKHTTFVPFGTHAFIPGQIVNTNMLTVFLGEGYYREMSTPDTVLLVQKRLTGLQNEIQTYHREMQSFGHHIQSMYSILGKPMHTPTLSDQVSQKITGQAKSLNTQDVAVPKSGPTSTNPRPTKPTALNPRDPTAALQPTRATRTATGRNEDGDEIVEIMEYFDDEDVPAAGSAAKLTPSAPERQMVKAFPDMPDFQPADYTTDENGDLVLANDKQAQMKDVFYESLDRTLKEFENSRVDAQELDQDEIDEIERIEREIMGDLYVPPAPRDGAAPASSKSTTTSSKQVRFDEGEIVYGAGGKHTVNFLDSVFSDSNTTSKVEIDEDLTKLETKDDEGDLLMDSVIIPTLRSAVPNVTADDFRNELTMPGQSTVLTNQDGASNAADADLTLFGKGMSGTRKAGLIEVLDEVADSQNPDESEQPAAGKDGEFDEYMAYLATLEQMQSERAPQTQQKEEPVKAKSTTEAPQKAATPQAAKPAAAKPAAPAADQLISEVVTVRQRPGKKQPAAATVSAAQPEQAAKSPEASKPAAGSKTDSQQPLHHISTSGAVTKSAQAAAAEQEELNQPSTSDIYRQYLASIQNHTTNDFFSQFLEDLDEDDDYDDYGYYGEDEDGLFGEGEDDMEDDMFLQNMKNVYSNLYNQPGADQSDQSNTQNAMYNKSSNKPTTGVPMDADGVVDPYAESSKGDEDYMNMFWNHMQSIVDQEDQDGANGKTTSASHLDDIDDAPMNSLPPQDRPVYSTFGLGQLRDGTHALIPKSTQSTPYTSSLAPKKPQTAAEAAAAQTKKPSASPDPALSLQPQAKKVSLFKQKRLESRDGQ